jgi:hypothetical protein
MKPPVASPNTPKAMSNSGDKSDNLKNRCFSGITSSYQPN